MHRQNTASFFPHTGLRLLGLGLFLCALFVPTARAAFTHSDSAQCTIATARVERALQLPDGFLAAISRVETGRLQGDGRLAAWPWSVNAAGVGYQYQSLNEAVEAVKAFQHQGIQSIDIGCMQVNIMHHPNAFPSLEAAFDPQTNALYAGHFLQQMHEKTGSWPRAAAAYHSQTPALGEAYLAHVFAEWAVPQDGRPLKTPLKTPASHSSLPAHMPPSLAASPSPQTTKPVQAHFRPPQRNFRPFQGMQHFSSAPPPARHTAGPQQGRGLASYRAAPVRMVNSMPYPSAY